MERLSIDEAIIHARKVAEEKYLEGFLYHVNIGNIENDKKSNECIKCAKEHERLVGWLEELKKRRELEERHRWIPVKERLPGEDVIVLVTVSGFYSHFTFSNTIELGNLCSDGSWFIEGYPDWDNPEVTAWMLLPEPYQQEE